MSRKGKVVLAVAGLAAVVGVAALVGTRKPKATEVLTVKVERQDIVSKVTASGKVQAEKKVDLSALVMGQIVRLAVREGDPVKVGDLLLEIDRIRAEADAASSAAALQSTLSELASARETMEQAARDFERARKNYQARILPEADFQRAQALVATTRAAFDSAEHRVDQFRAGLNASRDTLTKSTVRAPIDGVVTALRVQLGEVTVLGTMNNPGTQLLTISDMASVQAVLMVDETDMPAVALGQKAVLTLDSYPGRTFEGEVVEAGNSPILPNDPELQGLTTTSDAINFKVKVKLAAPPPSIRPGFSVSADIITGRREKALSVPLAAIVVRDSPSKEKTASGKLKTEEGVYRFEEGAQVGKARFVPVGTGIAGDLLIEARSGLAEGQEVVAGPFKALRSIRDGDPVARMPEKKRKELEREPRPGE